MSLTHLLALVGLFGSCLASSAIAGSANLLEASQTSGFVRPQDAFQKSCTIKRDGTLTGEILSGVGPNGGWKNRKALSTTIPASDLNQLRNWIDTARTGTIETRPAPCDAGSTHVAAGLGNTSLVIFSWRDCDRILINRSPSLDSILRFVGDWCEIETNAQ